jgi:hypothetical protein
MTYTICGQLIERATYTSQAQKDDMQLKLDVFLLNNRLSQDEYNELTQILVEKQIES